ncbi:hypothetical protein DL769_002122 [Monosporascus sp. CRB-8-3]|nr:hypothetical protein DL769_002122 [Monosporascus sp. CRB-8-3]
MCSLSTEAHSEDGYNEVLQPLPAGRHDPVCIVGMACRLPGDVRSPADFWDFIMNKKSSQSPVPAERFNINGFHHVDDTRAGVTCANGGYFLSEDVRQFDNNFFGINNVEATYMDPHQRKILEVTYECLESAGLSMEDVSGTNTGVYVGNFTVDYITMHFRDPDYLHRYSATGSDTDYVECHGTATAVGDVIEIDALGQCFAPRKDTPLMIGSVKPNFGHSEAASGLTSLIKVLLAFENAKVPPTFGVTKVNPKLNLEALNMKVVTDIQHWPRSIRRASINCFGYGGANSHAIVESLDSYLQRQPKGESTATPDGDHILILPISAKSSKSLGARVEQISGIAQNPTGPLRGLALTLTQRKSHFRKRQFLLAGTSTNGPSKPMEFPDSIPADPLPLAFVFTGQGAQYGGMARELLSRNRRFVETIRELDGVLRTLPPENVPTWTLEHAISDPSDADIHKVTHSQPLCTAIQIGLVNVLQSWGISPSAVVGHSSGEIAAAYAAGSLTASQSILVAYFRGYAASQVQTEGSMIAVGLGAQAAKNLISEAGLTGEVCIACVNDSENVTLSGPRQAIENVALQIRSQNKFCRNLETNGRAYHSYLMKEVGALYEALIAPHLAYGLETEAPSAAIPMYSSVADGDDGPRPPDTASPKYWRINLENSVHFNAALANLTQERDYHLIEIGPHHVLKGSIQRILSKLAKSHLPYSSTLAKNQDSDYSMKTLAGTMFLYGHSLIWKEVNEIPPGTAPLYNIPPYPWDYSMGLLWHEPRASIDLRNRKYVRHELLGSQQLGGNSIDWSWRNIPRLEEVSWMRDHKVEEQIVFPAAGYLAMAIEAVSQLQQLHDTLHSDAGFEFRNVSINAAFIVQNEENTKANEVELHTTIASRRLSTRTSSRDWYDFSISSWAEGQATVHCTGSIRTGSRIFPKETVTISDVQGYETWPMERWYNKLKEEGLNFGPHFNSVTSLSTDGNRLREDAISTTWMSSDIDTRTDYALHPIVIDACIQAAIFGGTAGTLSSLRAYLPVFISECRIRSPGACHGEAQIHTRSKKTGIFTRKIDCTLRSSYGVPVLDMKDVRMSMYTGKAEQGAANIGENTNLVRHPCLRVRWKPDIMRLDLGAQSRLDGHIDEFIMRQHPDLADDRTLSIFGALLDLAGHKTPGMRVLELGGGCGCKTKQWLSLLGNDTAFPRFRTWETQSFHENGEIQREDEVKGLFDVILIPGHATSKQYWKTAPRKILDSLDVDRGIVISRKTEEAVANLKAAQFAVTDVGHKIILGIRQASGRPLESREVLIVYRELSPSVEALSDPLATYLEQASGAARVQRVAFQELRSMLFDRNTVCISLLELEREFLGSMNQDDIDLLRVITNTFNDLIWITGTDMLGCADPNLTMSSGLSRSLMVIVPRYEMDDKEFIQSDGLLYVSRFYPDEDLNSLFRRRIGVQSHEQTQKATLASANPARLAIGKVGAMDTIYFQQIRNPPTKVPTGFVDIQVKAVSLNAKDVYTLHGRVEVRTGATAGEFSGVVVAVGSGVENVQPGDRVVVMAPNHFMTTERVPAWAVHQLLPGEEFTVMSTIPVAYSTALHALHDRARLRSGESVLIHGGSGALGLAAINIAQAMSAVIYTTKATGGRGVDVVMNTLTGDLMHATWDCVASFGRKTKEALEWYRSGRIKLAPIKIFEVADITQAYRYFSSKDRVGKVVISLENPESLIPVAEPRYQTIFNSEKSYLLVGCLGGLGRSLSRWIVARGARHLVFLGRSGCDKLSAQKFVPRLRSMGVEVTVIKGDVLSSADTKKAIQACVATGKPIGGVVQAAMGLHEALFFRMTSKAWHQGIDAKWIGTWNLHSALEGYDEALEFFLMTSSVSGTVGIATEANYCASNGFLDAFSRWRRQQGKPAISIGLGMISDVGYLHENPDIENILLRKGIYPLSEDEFLQVIDLALATGSANDPAEAHILTGMESFGFRNLMAKGFDVNNLPMQDPRAGLLAEALEAERIAQSGGDAKGQGRLVANASAWMKDLPELVSGSIRHVAGAASLREAVLLVILKQFSNLILTPSEQVDDRRPLAQFGVDSMIASEFRTWFWATFKVDIPFLDLMSGSKSLSSLADIVEEKLREG